MRIHCQRQKCSPRSVVSGYISLMLIYVGVRWSSKMRVGWKCGVDLRGGFTDWLECMRGYCTKLQIYVSEQAGLFTYFSTYKPKTELRTLRIYGATNQSINQSINRYSLYHYVLGLHILRTCGSVHGSAGLYIRKFVGLSMTTELAYSFSGFVWLYITVCLDWKLRQQYTWSENVVNLADRNTWQLHINC